LQLFDAFLSSPELGEQTHPVEMNSLFGQQGSWKGTSKITMMAIFKEKKTLGVTPIL
jgi:hypothetical protein